MGEKNEWSIGQIGLINIHIQPEYILNDKKWKKKEIV